MKRKEKKVIRQMKIVRSWDGEDFTYYRTYSDGQVEPATRKDADQYKRAYGLDIELVIGKPKEGTWNTFGS